jgi:hypothetical protein
MRILIALLGMAGLSVAPGFAQEVELLNAPAAAGTASSFVFGEGAPPVAAVFAVAPQRLERQRSSALGVDDWLLLGAAAPLRYFDYRSTVEALSEPGRFHEAELPTALVHNHAGFAGFEAGTVVANYYVYRILARHHHRTVARWGQVINLGALWWSVGHNYRLLSEDAGQR